MLVSEYSSIHQIKAQKIKKREIRNLIVQHFKDQSLSFTELLFSIITI